jgi:energy-coupling factor transport system substrate-specific component
MTVSRKKQFIITFAAFLVLGASFKVMTLIEGLTEVRPVNAIPPVAGLCFGWVGGLACGIGNLFADFFGELNWYSFLGVAANFIAAFLPYRLWHMFSNEAPNLHTKRNILLYLAISLINAFTTAWLLAFGLNVFFGMWIPTVYIYVFFNNFGFSALFGMPLLIILTSDSVQIQCEKRRRYIILGGVKRMKWPLCAVYAGLMVTVFVFVFLGLSPDAAVWIHGVSAAAVLGLVCQLV